MAFMKEEPMNDIRKPREEKDPLKKKTDKNEKKTPGPAIEGQNDYENGLDLITTAESSHELYQDFRLNHEEESDSEKSEKKSETSKNKVPKEDELKLKRSKAVQDPLEDMERPKVLSTEPKQDDAPRSTIQPDSGEDGPQKKEQSTEWVDDLLSDIIMEEPGEIEEEIVETQIPTGIPAKSITQVKLDTEDDKISGILDEPLEELGSDDVLDDLSSGQTTDEAEDDQPIADELNSTDIDDLKDRVIQDQETLESDTDEAEEGLIDNISIPTPKKKDTTPTSDLEEIKEKITTLQLELEELMINQTKMIKVMLQIEEKIEEIKQVPPTPPPKWIQTIISRLSRTREIDY